MSKQTSFKGDDSVIRSSSDHHDSNSAPTIYKDDIEDDPKFRPQSLWDGTQRKLIIYIMEGVGIIPPEGGIQIKLRYAPSKAQKLKYKTAAQYTEDPKWNELCYFDLSSYIQGVPSEDLAKAQLTMEYVSVKKNATLGEAVLCVPTELPEETVFDAWIDFKRTLGKGDLGTVHVRALYSAQPETVITNWDWRTLRFDPNRYMYLTMKEKVKTGDIICYDGIGTLPALTKVVANTAYSRLGLIFEAPSKYSRQNELYVLEVTRNRDKFQDAFKEARVKGVNIFRLWDRIHQIHANRIWWAPLTNPLPPGGAQRMRDWIWDLHDPLTHKPSLYYQTLPQPIVNFLEQYHWSPQKFESEIGELFSGRLILQALAIGGAKVTPPPYFCVCHTYVILTSADQYTPPIAVMTRQLYDEPILIRSVADRRDTVSLHSTLEVQAANSPIVAPKVTAVTANIPKLEVQKAETPLKSPPQPSPSSPHIKDEEKVSPRIVKSSRKEKDHSKDKEKSEKKDKDGDKKANDAIEDLTSPRGTLSRIVHRKRDRKDDGESKERSSTETSRAPASLLELPTYLKLKELAKKLTDSTESITGKDWTDKLKDASVENSQAALTVFDSLRQDKSETLPSSRLGRALNVALAWLNAEESLGERVAKALEIFETAVEKKISKEELASFGTQFLYFGDVLLTQIYPAPQVTDLSPEAVRERITDSLFDEEFEMYAATNGGDDGDSEATKSLMSALGKKGGHKRIPSRGENFQLLPHDRVVKWFKREQTISLLIDLERDLASAQLAVINAANAEKMLTRSKKGDEDSKESKKKEKDEKLKDSRDEKEKKKEAKEKEAKEKEAKEKEKEKPKDSYTARPSSRPSMFKRDTTKRDTAVTEVKPKLRCEIVEACAYFFESHLSVEGIFRISGSARNVARIYQLLLDPYGTLNVVNEDVHDVAGAFKQYLRSLEPPIIPFDLFDEAINWIEEVSYVQNLLKKLPSDNLKALERIIRLLLYTSQKSDLNKMDMTNLSIVFGPTLIRPAPERETPALYMEANEKSKNLVLFLTSRFDDIFVGDVLLKMYS